MFITSVRNNAKTAIFLTSSNSRLFSVGFWGDDLAARGPTIVDYKLNRSDTELNQTEHQMANKEQKNNPNQKKVAKLSLKEKRLKKQEKKKG